MAEKKELGHVQN